MSGVRALANRGNPRVGALDAGDVWPAEWTHASPPDESPTDLSGGAIPAWPDVDDRPTDPEWALAASAEVERKALAEAASSRPGAWSVAVLERLCPNHLGGGGVGTRDAGALIDGIVGLQRLINWAQASQQRCLAALARPGVALPLEDLVDVAASPWGIARDVPEAVSPQALLDDPSWGPALRDAAVRVAAVEVGCALHIAPMTARGRTERAVVMVDELPGTLDAHHAGDLDAYRVSIIAERTAGLDSDARRIVENSVLPVATERTAGRLRDLVDREVVRVDPDAAARREETARRGRGVRVETGMDGMGAVRADVSAPDAQLSFEVLDRIAGAVQAAGLAAGRGRGQIRADVFVDLFRDLAATGMTRVERNSGTEAGTGTETSIETSTGTETGTGTEASTGTETSTGTEAGTAESAATTETCPGAEHAEHHDRATVPTGPATVTPLQSAADRAADRNLAPGRMVPVCANVYVNASTLAGWDDEPAELAGHGVISAEFARALAESAGSIRAIAVYPWPTGGDRDAGPPGKAEPGPEWTADGHSTAPARARLCGSALDAGRTAYRAPTATAHYVTGRDRICTFMGCRARADRCDLDHRLPWDRGGASCPCNLDALCRFHHLIKTFTPWRATPGPDGALTWTSPTGRRYGAEPGHPLVDGDPHSPLLGDRARRHADHGAVPPMTTSALGSRDGVGADPPEDDPPPF